MNLPDDFDSTLSKVLRYNIFNEAPEQIRERLDLAVKGVAAGEGRKSMDKGVIDWTQKTIRQFEAAIHKEICDPQKGCLNEQYSKLMTSALTPEGVKSVAAVVLAVITRINPALAVSSI